MFVEKKKEIIHVSRCEKIKSMVNGVVSELEKVNIVRGGDKLATL